jgi:hypothetical protein
MKLFMVISFFFLFPLILSAQQSLPSPELADGKLILRHTVVPKENWYSLGRMYNLNPKELAAFNQTTIEKGLSVGQLLQIPLTNDNFAQSGQPATDEVFLPLHHVVREKEGLYRIGQDHNKIPASLLRSLNNLPSDAIQPGMMLVVGYLRVKKDQSALAAASAVNRGMPVMTEPVPKPAVNTTPPAEKPAVGVPVQEVKKTVPAPVVNAPSGPVATKSAPNETIPVSAAGGFFAGIFADQMSAGPLSAKTAMVASFKSTSGWKDRKYYALMSEIQAGTIVKYLNPSNGKFVYAKVLGELPSIRENDGITARLSNAAMSELGLDEGKYELKLQWTKQ